MGTRWRILVSAPHGSDMRAVERAIAARLAGLVAEMSHWDDTSLLCRFNRAPPGTWFSLPPDFASVIARALLIAGLSDGAFDPSLGALVDLWGFGPPGPQPVPIDLAIADARDRCGWERLAWDASRQSLRQPGRLSLDLSGIAKGYAADTITDLLMAHGLRHALVEVGGELAGRGIRPDGEPWWVDLENPPGLDLPPLRIALHGIAVATSGRYVRGDHNIDPRTGRPPANDVIAASVVATSATDADAWASALVVLGASAGLALATRHHIAARLVLDDGAERLSPALHAMLAD
nr:FAD:protein FMN transferase [Sphingomonas sp. 3P27F8]